LHSRIFKSAKGMDSDASSDCDSSEQCASPSPMSIDQTAYIASALFPNSAEFSTNFNCIEASKLIKSLQIPRMISKEIAEFATGQRVQCCNRKCMRDIVVLQEHKESYTKITNTYRYYEDFYDSEPDENYLCFVYKDPNTGTAQYAQRVAYEDWQHAEYFCHECIASVEFLCANAGNDCRCRDKASFIAACAECKHCGRWITDCDDDCDEGCYCAVSCDSCGDQYCTDPAQCVEMLDRCFVCSDRVCRRCSTQRDCPPEFEETICCECSVETYIECKNKECAVKCKLQFEDNRELFAKNTQTNTWQLAMERCAFCEKFVCFDCSEMPEKAKTVYRSYSEELFCLKCNKYIGCCCEEHRSVKGLCYRCHEEKLKKRDYDKVTVQRLAVTMFDVYSENTQVTKKEMRREIGAMFNMSPKKLRRDEKYLSAFDILLLLVG